MTRHDTYTGGEHYWIMWHDGNHHVYCEDGDKNVIVFTGWYERCVAYINQQVEVNYEYDHNL